MKHVLIVDDEEQLLLTFQAGFESFKDRFTIITARNGQEAIHILGNSRINLVVTDLKMPEMDGFELLAFLKNNFPEFPAVVMTAFATPEIEGRLGRTGMIKMLEKPVDFDELTQLILSLLENDLTGGVLTGISLPSFIQLIEMEQNTCLMEVSAPKAAQGLLYFYKGELYDAVYDKLVGEAAAFKMLALKDVKINFRTLPSKTLKRRIHTNIIGLLMESARLEDEIKSEVNQVLDNMDRVPSSESTAIDESQSAETVEQTSTKGEINMSTIKEVLEKFKSIDGFQAVGAFSPNGELVAECNASSLKVAELGALANEVLLKAQKASEIMNVGRGQLVHVEAPKAHVICRCLNESTDFTATAAGRAHVHLVLILDADGNIAMGKMKMATIIQEVAEFFR